MNEQATPVGFVEIDHTADRALRVWAQTPAGLFEQAARGMFALIADLRPAAETTPHELALDIDDLEAALVDWLNELLYWHETRRELYSDFTVQLGAGRLYARFAGQPAESLRAVVKAATFHNLAIRQDEAGLWRADIVFDT